MLDSLYLAWRYMRFHRAKTSILVASITLMIFLPAGLDRLVQDSARQLRKRAATTPLIIGAKGSDVDLVLNCLYFESEPPVPSTMEQVHRVEQSELAQAVPLYVRFQARGRPVVGTTLDYLSVRGLQMARGRPFALLGECTLGAEAARMLQLQPGDALLTSPENVFDLGGVYPLKLRVSGILQPAGTPDDGAVLVDIKTSWIIQGLGHGHQDLQQPGSDDVLLERQENRLTANAALVQYTEITPENVDSFHFHGDPAQFPITGVIAVPGDEKAKSLLMGRYQSSTDVVQVVRPDVVMDRLLRTILRIRGFMLAGAMLLAVATILSVVLVFVLSLRLRKQEMSTMAKLGCSSWRIASIVTGEILMVAAISLSLATGMAWLAGRFGEQAIHWLLL